MHVFSVGIINGRSQSCVALSRLHIAHKYDSKRSEIPVDWSGGTNLLACCTKQTDRPMEVLVLHRVGLPVAVVPCTDVMVGTSLGTRLLVGLPHIPRQAAVDVPADSLVMAVQRKEAARSP